MNHSIPEEREKIPTTGYGEGNVGASEQVRLIAELDEKDKSVIFGIIETMLTKKKFKDFFEKNVATL